MEFAPYLIDVVIVDLIVIDCFGVQNVILMLSCSLILHNHRFVVSNVVQAKEKDYCDQHPIDLLFLLIIVIFGCLHK
jgi:hypothetical protein